jgi:hypothetical protein
VQRMTHSQQTTIFGIFFWTLLLASVGLVDRYRWLQTAWALVCIGFLAFAAVFSIVWSFTNRNTSKDVNGPASSPRGNYYLPRWMMWVVADDEQYDKYLQRRRLIPPGD